MKRATREWVRKAEADYRLAAKIGRGSEPFHDQLCFHCQQSSEKYLKALLEELGHSIPHTHALGDLLAAVLPSHTALRPLHRGMNFLTRFAVGVRYPGDNATKRQSQGACVGPGGCGTPPALPSASGRPVAGRNDCAA